VLFFFCSIAWAYPLGALAVAGGLSLAANCVFLASGCTKLYHLDDAAVDDFSPAAFGIPSGFTLLDQAHLPWGNVASAGRTSIGIVFYRTTLQELVPQPYWEGIIASSLPGGSFPSWFGWQIWTWCHCECFFAGGIGLPLVAVVVSGAFIIGMLGCLRLVGTGSVACSSNTGLLTFSVGNDGFFCHCSGQSNLSRSKQLKLSTGTILLWYSIMIPICHRSFICRFKVSRNPSDSWNKCWLHRLLWALFHHPFKNRISSLLTANSKSA